MMTLIYIFIGGGIGSLLRYGLGVALPAERFPIGLLLCNLLGCFLIGVAAGVLDKPSTLQLAIITGLLGGFTTFSSFSDATIKMLGEGAVGAATIHVLISILGGLALTFLGYQAIGIFNR